MHKFLATLLGLMVLTLSACPRDEGGQAPPPQPAASQQNSGAADATDAASAADAAGAADAADAIDTADGTPDAANPCGEDLADNPGDAETTDEETAPLTEEELIMQPMQKMVDNLNQLSLDGFQAAFHPDSPELAEMLEFFNEFMTASQSVELAKLEITERLENAVKLDYEIVFSNQPGLEEAERESGVVTVVPGEDGNWVIMDLD